MTTATTGTGLNDLPLVTQLPVEHLCDLSVDLEPAQLIATPVGSRMTFIAVAYNELSPDHVDYRMYRVL
jgi:hypothetical protein